MPSGATAAHVPSYNPMLTFVQSVQESVSVEQLGANYIATIPGLVSANAYGFYLLDSGSRRPNRVAVRGAVERFVTAYEDGGYSCDPVLQRALETGQPVFESSLFSRSEWQKQPLREALRMRRLARLMEAPIVVRKEAVGLLYFTRLPEDPPFTPRDIDTLRMVCASVRAAANHAVEYSRSLEQCALLKASLDIVNAPLLLSDRQGNLHYANKPAQVILDSKASSALRSGLLNKCLVDNLAELLAKGTDAAVTVLPLEGTPGSDPPCLLVRSVTVPGAGEAVLTALYHKEHAARDLSYLRDRLPPREIEVLQLVAQGMRNKEIAKRLFVTTNTVKYHMKRIFETMQVGSRSELLSKVYSAETAEAIVLN